MNMDIQARGYITKQVGRLFGYSLLIFTAFFLAIPIILLMFGSLKVDSEMMHYPPRILPVVPQWTNYVAVFVMTPFVQIALRTGGLGLLVAVITTAVSSLVGYAFARLNVKGNKQLFLLVVSTMIVPGIVLLIPTFIIFARLKLTNTFWPWIIGAFAGSPFDIFLFRQFFLGFPRELEEAAEVDGCGPFRIFWQIFMPNAKPVIATVMILTFGGVWGDYLTPLIYLNANNQLMGVAMVNSFVNPNGNTLVAITMAGTVLYILPPIIMFFMAQKSILQGVVTSGLKG